MPRKQSEILMRLV